MATFNQARYRYIDWIANRILEASELDRLQQIAQGVAPDNVTPWVWDLGALYSEGATLNVTPSINGRTVTLTPTNNALPMLVFVRGRWEILQTTEAVAVTLAANQTILYLNWWLVIRDNTVDPSLVDSATGAATAEMGELVLQVSAADNSTTALNTALYFQQNPKPIGLFTFSAGSPMSVVSTSGIQAQALASGSKAGFVTLSTATSNGKALSSDDPAVTNSRNPNALSVTDASVRTPVLNGNGQTLPIGTGPGQDPGGISTAKLVHVPTSQTAAAVIEAVRAEAAATDAAFTAHKSAPLGNGVHQMPTATQVGAAPASHVGQALGLSTSHPPNVNADSGGFQVLRDPGAAAQAMDAGFGILMAGALQAGLLHNGDVYSLLSKAITAYPAGRDGDGAQTTQTLGLLSVIASVLAGHVNKTSHNNPHGLAAADIGAATTAYVNSLFNLQVFGNGFCLTIAGVMIQCVIGAYSSSQYNNTLNTINFNVPFPTGVLGAPLVTTLTTGNDYSEGALFTVTSWSKNGVSVYNERNADHGGNPNAPCIWAIGR